MSKPDDIPQGIWDTASALVQNAVNDMFASVAEGAEVTDEGIILPMIARALAEERAACSLIATAAVNRPGVDPWAKGYRCAGADISKLILDRP